MSAERRRAGGGRDGAAPAFPYRERQERVRAALQAEGIDLAVVADFEGMRDRSLRWLCGQPSDALLFLSAAGSWLVAWDLPLAERHAVADRLQPYALYERSLPKAVAAAAEELARQGAPGGRAPRVELTAGLPFPEVEEVRGALPAGEVVCRRAGLGRYLLRLRARKDEAELACLRQAAALTDRIVDLLEDLLRSRRRPPSELDLALRVEREARRLGAEGLGFETLAAGPGRSFAIHAHPTFTAGPFGGPGLSILDFGVRWQGYTSDVTLTAVRPPLSAAQEGMIEAVEQAYRQAVGGLRPGASTLEIARGVDELFRRRGQAMPHALGHGIGLDAHEAPLLRSRETGEEAPLEPGMVVTIEPGLYSPETGGVRLENDLLITASGSEALTRCRLLRLPG